MNTPLKTAVCAAALLAFTGAPVAMAQYQRNDQQRQQDRTQPNRDRAQNQDRTNPDLVGRTATFDLMLQRSSKMMGTDVYNRAGEKIGDVADFVVSRRTGEIDSVLVNTGAILGVGGKEARLPYHSFTWNRDKNRLETTMTKQAIDAMPDFDRQTAGDLALDNLRSQDEWDRPGEMNRDRDMNRPGDMNRDRNDMNRDRNANPARDGVNTQDRAHGGPYGADRGILLSTIVGHNLDCVNDSCGEVEDTIVEAVTGRVVFLVIDPDENFLGIADTLRLAPYNIARWDNDASDMEIATTKERLLAAPEFTDDLTPFAVRGRITDVYKVYGEQAPDMNRSAADRWNNTGDMNKPGMNNDRDSMNRDRNTTPNRDTMRDTNERNPNDRTKRPS